MPAVSKMLVLLAVVAAPMAFAGNIRDVDHFEKSSDYRGKCSDYKCPDGWGRMDGWDKKECGDYRCKDDECCKKGDDYKDDYDRKDDYGDKKKGKY